MWSTRKGAKDWGEIIRRVHAIIPEAQFRFLGTLTDNERVLRDLIFACNCIEIVPEFQPDELPKLLADSTAGALPTYAEGFGLALLEQLAAEIPTVSYDAPGPRSILQRTLPDLLVPVGNVEQFSAVLIQILSADLAGYRRSLNDARRRRAVFCGQLSQKRRRASTKCILLDYGAAIVNSPRMANAADVVLQIVPRVSDNPDGVTDYALNLARNLLGDTGSATVFAAAEQSRISEKEGFKITPMDEGAARLAKDPLA